MVITRVSIIPAALALAAFIGPGGSTPQKPTAAARQANTATASIAELWIEPEGERELLYGVGGKRLAPDPGGEYQVIEIKVGGFSEGYTVVDGSEREWSTKFPPEAAI